MNPTQLTSTAGVRVEINANGSLRRLDCDGVSLALFVGSELEGGPTNLYLRCRTDTIRWLPLLGPRSRTVFRVDPGGRLLSGSGAWLGIDYSLALRLAEGAPAWFWHIDVKNTTSEVLDVDLTYAQDLALASYGALRMNEYYVSQYIDHTPLQHAVHGCMIGSRQNQAVGDRHPWCVIGSLRVGAAFATDALQFYGLAGRAGAAPPGLLADLPAQRLQHEHSMTILRDAPLRLEPGGSVTSGFFGRYLADHPEATSAADLMRADEALALPEATPIRIESVEPTLVADGSNSDAATQIATQTATLFSAAPLLDALDLDRAALRELFAPPWRHEELDEGGELLSFFHGADQHVVLRAKELRVLRPHGQLLRTGTHITPDEQSLTSTVWMSGVFHSMVTQGHVNINRLLSTVRGYLQLFRAQGQRVFVQVEGVWQLLDVPSAFEMAPDGCRWIYRHAKGEIQVRAEARSEPQALTLSIQASAGAPLRFLIVHHVALNGDDGVLAGAVRWWREREDIMVAPAAGSELAGRFPQGAFRIAALSGTSIERIGGDELLFLDGRSRQQPYLCLVTAPAVQAQVSIQGQLISAQQRAPLRVERAAQLTPTLTLTAPAATALAAQAAQIAEIVPWCAQNALVHYLAPRGLEQYSGGGWGTRDVCQGPVEMLLALGRTQPIREVLMTLMGQQNPDGDWPQWFMFFERERAIRADDSNGDIVFWPLLVLAQYLIASGDASVLDERVACYAARGSQERISVWEHVQRALSLIERRVIPGTALAAYAHGDWNDSLQPVDPRMRERLCSAWTVTLHVQMLTTLATALRAIGRASDAIRCEQWAEAVRRDFQRLLIADGVLTGYALFEDDGRVRYLLHPRDETTGVQYSALAMIQAILENLLTTAQVRAHLGLIDAHLSAADGLRLFDRPMAYQGGPQRLFQRAESATFFGREIGLMYTHAHLRYAQALAHLGEAQRFFRALCQANPIGIRALVPNASLRQANCYFSSSDAAFRDRYQASAEYERIARGTIALEGGWRVYSSGAGIMLGLIVRRFLGLSWESRGLSVDPVMPGALDGMWAKLTLLGRPLEIHYRIGSAGCGVNAVRLNDNALSFTSDANPYRRGAAVVSATAVLDRLTNEGNVLSIDIG